MNKTLLWLALAMVTPTVWANEAGLRNCRVIALAGARLACYDALPLALPAAPGAPPAAVITAQALAGFGLEPAGEKPQEVRSHIAGLFEGWRAGDRIRLANGQVWRVVDDSRADYSLRDPPVTVRRGAFGSYLLDIEGAKQLPRVRRVE